MTEKLTPPTIKKPTKSAVKKAIMEMFLTTIEHTDGISNYWSEDDDGGRVMINLDYKGNTYSFQYQRNYLSVIDADWSDFDENPFITENRKMLTTLLEEKLAAVIAFNEQKSGIRVS